jgi:ATP-dependent DNA ligase
VGLDSWAQVVERGHEGYVGKDQASAYEGGGTRRWLKVKQKDWTVEGDAWRRRFSAR